MNERNSERTVPGADMQAHDATLADIEARIRWARVQGYVAWFWPDVSIDAWRACLLEIERVSALILRADQGLAVGIHELPAITELSMPVGADPGSMGVAAFTSGMGPLLGYWIERGYLQASSEITSALAHHLDHSRRRAVRMQAAADAAIDALAAVGLKPILVKAAHTARFLFDEPGLRPAADIDLVVKPDRFRQAEAALAERGYRLVKQQREPRKSDWAPPGMSSELRSLDYTHEDNPFTIEIHASLDRAYYGVHVLRFGPTTEQSVVSAPELHPQAGVLGQPLLTAYIAAHASEELHQLQLIRLFELVLLIRRDVATGVLDWREMDGLLSSCAGHRFTYPAFALAERLCPGTVEPWFLAILERVASQRMIAVLERMSPATAQRLDKISLDERFLWVETSIDVARRIRHLFRRPSDGRSISRQWTDRFTRFLRGRVSVRRDSGEASDSRER